MAHEEADHSSILERIEPGHWRRTYKKDGLTTDLYAKFCYMWFDLSDFIFEEGMTMTLKGVGSLFEDGDSYQETVRATAKGLIDNASLEYIDRQEGDPWRINTVDVTLRFERAWGDPPQKKFNLEGAETDETWTLAESMAGYLLPVNGKLLPPDREPYLHLELKVPNDFLPKIKEAMAQPGRIGRIRLGTMIKVFEESVQAAFAEIGDHLDYMIDRKHPSPAYLTSLSFGTLANLSDSTAKPDVSLADEIASPLPTSRPAAATSTAPNFTKEIAQSLKWCAMALAVIAAILLFK